MSKKTPTHQSKAIQTQPSDTEIINHMAEFIQKLTLRPNTRRVYVQNIKVFIKWMLEGRHSTLNRASVLDYMELLEGEKKLSLSTQNVILSAIRILSREMYLADEMDHKTYQQIKEIKSQKTRGNRSGTWLSPQEAYALIDEPDPSTPRGLRDRAILAVGIGCGLRRSEIVGLTYAHLQFEKDSSGTQCPVFRDIIGKGNRYRTVPLPDWAYASVMAWAIAAQDAVVARSGRYTFVNLQRPIFRRIHRLGKIEYQKPLSDQAVYFILNKHAAGAFADSKALDTMQSGKQAILAPHDLRRTYARLAKQGGAPLDQIQVTLGHESISTTERYLNTELDIDNAPSRYIDIYPD